MIYSSPSPLHGVLQMLSPKSPKCTLFSVSADTLSRPCNHHLDCRLLPLTPFGLPTFTLTALHSILHTVSRINSLEYRSDVTPIFMSFKCFLWLSVQSQILGLVYKALHVLAPTHSPAPPAPLQTLQLSSAPQRHCAYLPPLTASSP